MNYQKKNIPPPPPPILSFKDTLKIKIPSIPPPPPPKFESLIEPVIFFNKHKKSPPPLPKKNTYCPKLKRRFNYNSLYSSKLKNKIEIIKENRKKNTFKL